MRYVARANLEDEDCDYETVEVTIKDGKVNGGTTYCD